MLKSFEVKNYALIEHIKVEFGEGLNIITGETGAGKSILIDAMGLLLGVRASSEVIRKGAEKAVVEGIFNVSGNNKIKTLLLENEIDFSDEMILRREISMKGTNRCFANDTPVNLSVIKDIGDLLVDLHGQHEHQSLLNTETHIDYLDQFEDYSKLLEEYFELYSKLISKNRELKSLKEKESSLKEKKDFYSFQIKEIDAVSPEADEEGKLNEQLNVLENFEKLTELTTEAYNIIYESENSVHDSAVKIKNLLSKLNDIDKSFGESLSEAESALAQIKDISSFIERYKDKVDLDPDEIEGIRERLGAINLLKKKYGGSVKSILEYRKKIGEEFEFAENFVDKIKSLEKELKDLRILAGAAAEKISKKRELVSSKVKSEIENSLKELGIPKPEFRTHVSKSETDSDDSILIKNKKYNYYRSGIDKVEFFVSTNAGEDPKPLVKVASGGEVSRIMLSLKSVFAKSDKLPLLIFDEIDVGVSGRIAQKVGNTLKKLSKSHQIIAITHLPQIAGLADHHFAIEKIERDDRVSSSIQKLNVKERITEVAKLLSGEKITEASLKSAKELIDFKE
jgi:DNA repair protein RecN (Recombination protein N)